MGEPLRLSDVLCIVEARTKIIGASSVLVGTAYAAWLGHSTVLLQVDGYPQRQVSRSRVPGGKSNSNNSRRTTRLATCNCAE